MFSTVSNSSGLTLAVSWGDRPKRLVVSLVACLALLAATPASPVSSSDNAPRISVIVRQFPGFGGDLRGLVKDLGGRVGVGLGIIDAFEAKVPAAVVDKLAQTPGDDSETPNGWSGKSWSGKSWSGKSWSGDVGSSDQSVG